MNRRADPRIAATRATAQQRAAALGHVEAADCPWAVGSQHPGVAHGHGEPGSTSPLPRVRACVRVGVRQACVRELAVQLRDHRAEPCVRAQRAEVGVRRKLRR